MPLSRDDLVAVLAAAAEHILPSDDLGAGAKEARVDRFFAVVVEDQRLLGIRALLDSGAALLDRVSRAENGAGFRSIARERQAAIIARLSRDELRPDPYDGPTFIHVLIVLTLEGFLGDPRHGGNANGVGWDFVGYSPLGRGAP